MGYHLTIGNAELAFNTNELYCAPTVVGFADIEAPVFPNDEMTGNTSERSPSYTAWHDFAALTGLTTLFFGTGWDGERGCYKDCPEGYHREEGLIAHHPGVAVLCDGDLQEVRRALAEWKAKHPDTVPGFGNWDGTHIRNYDYTLARLIWLEFWIAWALKNCERPAFGNT